MKLPISKEGVFTPNFNKNKELPVTDQITVRYRQPTVAIKNRCRSKPQAKAISRADGRVEQMEITIDKDDLATLKEMIISISNCSYGEGDGPEQKIVSAQNLIDAPLVFEPLLKEIVKEFDRVLDESNINEKN
ncbi:MAG: hypothetical protein FWC21_06585 [Treponema sp.]|nr:hypothetical protein [Treponema sp.]